jgi:hypothetical protein
MMMTRCGIDIDEYFDFDDFKFIIDFNTRQTVNDIVNNSFSEFDHATCSSRQGGIPAGGDFRFSENTTACPLTTRRKVQWSGVFAHTCGKPHNCQRLYAAQSANFS